MNPEEILKNIKAFIGAENKLANQEAENLIQVFKVLLDKEVEEYEDKLSKSDNLEELINPNDKQINIDILSAIEKYKDVRKQFKQKVKKEKETNLSRKKEILKEYKELMNSTQKIAELINGIKEIRISWSEIGEIPMSQHSEIQTEYSKLNDEFNYNLNIYKELKDNDLKRNYSLKNQVIHKVKELKNEKLIKNVEAELKKIENEWVDIGPTYKEHWNKIKEDYWTEVHSVYDRIKLFYKSQKEKFEENLKLKIKFIEDIKKILEEEIVSHKQWEDTTNTIKDIQQKWRITGKVPIAKNKVIWEDFRNECDKFFDNKKAFYNKLNAANKNNIHDKKELIKKVEELISNADYKKGFIDIKNIQQKWKEIGHAGRNVEQKLWKDFRSKCDDFFDKLSAHNKTQRVEDKKNFDIQKQRDVIVRKINQITKEVLNYENNVGFFKNASSASDLLKGVLGNIEKGKKEIEKLKNELKHFNKNN